MGRFKWQPWAYNQGIGSTFLVFTGAIISFWYPNMILASVNLIVSVMLFALEWISASKPTLLGPLSSNFYIRAALYLLAVVPSMFQAPTQTGGLCLFTCSVTYLRAAIGGESGLDALKKTRR